MNAVKTRGTPPVEGLRERRAAEESLRRLRRAFDAAAPGRETAPVDLRAETARLRDALLAFLAFEEGPEGWPDELVLSHPRMIGRAERLRLERAALRREVLRLAAQAGEGGGSEADRLALRQRFERIDAPLGCHLREARDLVLDAYTVDLGPGD